MHKFSENKKPYAIEYDLSNCDKEPIHLIRYVQSHACILVVDVEEGALPIIQASNNTESFIGSSLDSVLGEPVSSFFPELIVSKLKEAYLNDSFDQINPVILDRTSDKQPSRQIIAHRSENVLVLEIEYQQSYLNSSAYFQKLEKILNQLQLSADKEVLFDQLTQGVKELTGYDRIMIYQFDQDWNGEVIAEAREERLESYLGLHYPATDIPAQARALFLRNQVRIISDISESAAVIYPVVSPKTKEPLDLSDAIARGTSPIHIEYLQNMGVVGTLNVSIIVKNELWGLIACHHYSTKRLDYRVRAMIKLLSQVVSGYITLHGVNSLQSRSLQAEKVRAELFDLMSKSWDLNEIITSNEPSLLHLIDSTGAILFMNRELKSIGEVPPQEDVLALIDFLSVHDKNGIVACNGIAHDPAFEHFTGKNIIGFLALRISPSPYECIIWFRPEYAKEIAWGGKPQKSVSSTENSVRLSPRKSFEKYIQKIDGQCRPWEAYEVDIVKALGEDIKEIVVQKFAELQKLNSELEDAYGELESFSYTVSHDLRTPLRGIEGFVGILKEDYGDKFDEYGKMVMQTIVDSVGKMNAFINDILTISRVGRSVMIINDLNIREIITEVVEKNLALEPSDRNIVVHMPDYLPSVQGDKTLVVQVFDNLLSNAIKYTKKEREAVIEISFIEETDEVSFFIKDNGIGFDKKYEDRIFEVFSRLVTEEEFAGTGIGLAIVKRIINRHNGSIGVESEPGVGSNFYVRLNKKISFHDENGPNTT